MADQRTVVQVLREARRHVARSSDADFLMTDLDSVAAALSVLDDAIGDVEHDGTVSGTAALFAPTGWLQDVSIAAGWGDEFLALSARLDAALSE